MATHVVNPELVAALKRLRLGRIVDTLPERLVLAEKQEMSFDDLLLLIVTDEIARHDMPLHTIGRPKQSLIPI